LQKLAKQIVNEELSARRCQQLGSALLCLFEDLKGLQRIGGTFVLLDWLANPDPPTSIGISSCSALFCAASVYGQVDESVSLPLQTEYDLSTDGRVPTSIQVRPRHPAKRFLMLLGKGRNFVVTLSITYYFSPRKKERISRSVSTSFDRNMKCAPR